MLVFSRDSFDIRRSTWSIEWPVRSISANLIFHFAFVTQRKTKSRHSFLVERIFVRERWLRPFASFSRLNIVFLEMWFHLTAILNRCDCIWPSLCFHRQFSIYFRLWNFQDGECRSCRITVNLGNRISQLKFFCIVLVRMTSNVALESNVVGECVRQTVVWAAELLQVLSSAILSSSPSSFALYPTSAVLPARTGQVLRCLKQVNMETTGN